MRRTHGRVKFFQRNAGYIINDSGLDVAVHGANIIPEKGRRNRTVFDGDVVSYVEFENEGGGLVALNVKVESRRTTVVFPDDVLATARKLKETFSAENLKGVVTELEAV